MNHDANMEAQGCFCEHLGRGFEGPARKVLKHPEGVDVLVRAVPCIETMQLHVHAKAGVVSKPKRKLKTPSITLRSDTPPYATPDTLSSDGQSASVKVCST